jgi:transposase
MSRYRLLPAPAQQAVLRDHCTHARYVWNLAVEQHQHWHAGRKSAPAYLEQCRQLTQARAEYPWLAEGSQMVQQQALRDFGQDWAEKTSTDIARRFDLIRVEDLQIKNMIRSAKGTRDNRGRNVRAKAGLNREILRSGWGLLVRRLEEKAPGRVERINPGFTSQRCWMCGQVDPKSRESQAVFVCTACGYADRADVNAAGNIAAGHAVTARGGFRDAGPVNREPHLLAS